MRVVRWHLWGLAAGLLGLAANLGADDQGSLTEAQRRAGAATVAELERGGYHLGVVAGVLAVVCLALAATGWRRWADGPGAGLGLAAPAVSTALTVSAAALLVAYGFRGGLAEYLPGGINDDNFPAEGLYVLFVINDTAPWFGWLGVVIAAVLVAWLALVTRAFPVWLGIVSAVAVLPPLVVMLLTGAVAIAGVVGPLWLVVASAALALGRRERAGAREPAAATPR